MKKVQIYYPIDKTGEISPYFIEEAHAMKKYGFIINSSILNDIDAIIYRGPKIWSPNNCINHPKILQGWKEIRKTSFMHEYYPIIAENSIPTVFISDLSEEKVKEIASDRKWESVFVKSPSRSLFFINDWASKWPDTPIDKMKSYFKESGLKGPFAIRKFIDDSKIFYNEQRYWILKGCAYHPSNAVPDFVQINARKLYEFSNSNYFTIDVAGNYIVEINPGESSDRGGDNSLDFFCDIFTKAFL